MSKLWDQLSVILSCQKNIKTETTFCLQRHLAFILAGNGLHSSYLRYDADFRSMLSTMVHEANFLVENNLSSLVEEIDECEQQLFKLNSILSAVGIEGETEVLKIIRESLASASSAGRDGSVNRESILKAIRGMITAANLATWFLGI